MTPEQRANLIKSLIVIASGILSLLAAFGPLAAYRDYILLAMGSVAVVASVLGITLVSPVAQAREIQATRKAAKRRG